MTRWKSKVRCYKSHSWWGLVFLVQESVQVFILISIHEFWLGLFLEVLDCVSFSFFLFFSLSPCTVLSLLLWLSLESLFACTVGYRVLKLHCCCVHELQKIKHCLILKNLFEGETIPRKIVLQLGKGKLKIFWVICFFPFFVFTQSSRYSQMEYPLGSGPVKESVFFFFYLAIGMESNKDQSCVYHTKKNQPLNSRNSWNVVFFLK